MSSMRLADDPIKFKTSGFSVKLCAIADRLDIVEWRSAYIMSEAHLKLVEVIICDS